MDEISIAVSAVASIIALLSAIYSRQSRNIAQEANNITVHQSLRPLRLTIYNSMKEFAHYCSTYRTLQHMNAVDGTRDLIERIETLKWELDQYGPLNMPDVEKKALEFNSKGWELQRVLDRLSGFGNKRFEADEDNMHTIIEWFSEEKKQLKILFEIYLKNA